MYCAKLWCAMVGGMIWPQWLIFSAQKNEFNVVASTAIELWNFQCKYNP